MNFTQLANVVIRKLGTGEWIFWGFELTTGLVARLNQAAKDEFGIDFDFFTIQQNETHITISVDCPHSLEPPHTTRSASWQVRLVPGCLDHIKRSSEKSRATVAGHLREWIEVAASKNAQNRSELKAQKSSLFPGKIPDNQDLVKLAERLERKEPLQRKVLAKEARKITGETAGNDPEAKQLLAVLRAGQSQGRIKKFTKAQKRKD